MERDTNREHDRLRVLIEELQRAGKSERQIEAAMREELRAVAREPRGPRRRPGRLGRLRRRARR